MIDLLPIGSVITVNNSNRMLTIIGYLPKNTENGNVYDYFCTNSSVGLNKNEDKLKVDRDFFNINHNDISTVYFMGYINEDFHLYKKCFSIMKEKIENNIIVLTDEDISDIVNEVKKDIKGVDNHEG